MKKQNILLILLLCVLSFGVYANSLHGEFLIDDYTAIMHNEQLHNLKTFFSSFSLRAGMLYQLIYAVLWQLSGGDVFGYHLFNVLTHVGCTALLFILCNVLFKDRMLAFLAGLIFAVHPIHTEAVSWISGGHYALSSLFYIAAMIFYCLDSGSLWHLFLAVFFFVVSMLCGNAAVGLPLLFYCYDFCFREKTRKDEARRIRVFLLLAILVVSLPVIGSSFINGNNLRHSIFHFRGFNYLIVVAKAFVYYLKIIYLPVARGLYHPFAYNTVNIAKISPAFFGSLFVIMISVYAFIKCRKKYAPLSFAIAWFYITYLPYSNIIPVCNIVSERYVYLPSAGVCILLAYLFMKVWEIINNNVKYKKFFRILGMLALVLFLLSYSILTIKRNREYKDLITYWETNISNFPDGFMAYNNLAGTYYQMGNVGQAITYSWVNLMINPKQPHVWYNLGNAYRHEKDLKWAKYCYEQSIGVDKSFAPAAKALAEIESELKLLPKDAK